jgi:hypothetical protein
MTPDTEEWYSGQTQYRGTKAGYKMMIDEAHRVGIKVLSYCHAGGGGIAGLENYLRHPEIFATGNEGFGLYNTFLAERAYHGEYAFPDVTGTQRWLFWLPIWSGSGIEAAEWSAKEINGSIDMFGWDGVRWDQPVEHEKLIRERVLAAHPNSVWGYNVCFARPGGKTFLPPRKDTTYFHSLAANHGMMMDESVRGYAGDIRPYYDALASEADSIKRIGGLPLIITFDQGTAQDGILDCRIALAAGERYTYNTSCGNTADGSPREILNSASGNGATANQATLGPRGTQAAPAPPVMAERPALGQAPSLPDAGKKARVPRQPRFHFRSRSPHVPAPLLLRRW